MIGNFLFCFSLLMLMMWLTSQLAATRTHGLFTFGKTKEHMKKCGFLCKEKCVGLSAYAICRNNDREMKLLKVHRKDVMAHVLFAA